MLTLEALALTFSCLFYSFGKKCTTSKLGSVFSLRIISFLHLIFFQESSVPLGI